MEKAITSFILVFSFISCGQVGIISSYDLPEDAKDLIPFHRDTTLIYLSQQDIEFRDVLV